jgi:DNA-binding NtrC family response regulator
VDDESGALLVRKTLLERSGYAVLTAINAADALKIFFSSTIDLIVSDHLLSDATGAEMALQMKSAKPGIPVLLLSGIRDVPAGTLSADRFLAKIDGPEELLRAVAELLRYRRFQIAEGGYSAEIACDTAKAFKVWHYVIQKIGSTEILSWSQATNEKAAVRAAKKELRALNRRLQSG